MSRGKCFAGETKAIPTPTLQTSSHFQRSAVLPPCTLGLLCEGFWAAGVINSKQSAFGEGRSSLLLNDFQPLAFQGLNVPC